MSARPQTLMMLAEESRKTFASTEKLYVLRVDFPLKPETSKAIQEGLQPLRDKYDLDFLVLEPGITVKRFNDCCG